MRPTPSPVCAALKRAPTCAIETRRPEWWPRSQMSRSIEEKQDSILARSGSRFDWEHRARFLFFQLRVRPCKMRETCRSRNMSGPYDRTILTSTDHAGRAARMALFGQHFVYLIAQAIRDSVDQAPVTASAFLVDLAGQCFLATAGHVIRGGCSKGAFQVSELQRNGRLRRGRSQRSGPARLGHGRIHHGV